jgi:hypothetical protein
MSSFESVFIDPCKFELLKSKTWALKNNFSPGIYYGCETGHAVSHRFLTVEARYHA